MLRSSVECQPESLGHAPPLAPCAAPLATHVNPAHGTRVAAPLPWLGMGSSAGCGRQHGYRIRRWGSVLRSSPRPITAISDLRHSSRRGYGAQGAECAPLVCPSRRTTSTLPSPLPCPRSCVPRSASRYSGSSTMRRAASRASNVTLFCVPGARPRGLPDWPGLNAVRGKRAGSLLFAEVVIVIRYPPMMVASSAYTVFARSTAEGSFAYRSRAVQISTCAGG